MPVIKNNNNRFNTNSESSSSPRPIYYQDYFKLLQAISSQDYSTVKAALKNARNLRFIISYRDPERNFETPLHYCIVTSNGNCSGALISLLMSQTANTRSRDGFGVTPYQLGAKTCRNWMEVEELFDYSSARGDILITTAPVIGTATSLTPDKEKLPYEYHIVINVPMSLFKGAFTAFSRFLFEKLQEHFLFVREHSTLFFVAQLMMESILMSATNLLYFSDIKGNMNNLNAVSSASLYFSMDLALTFGFGLINSRLQPLLDSDGEKESMVLWVSKKFASSGLFTLFFLLSNLSIILGEKFQDHKVEALLNLFFNAIIASSMHHVAYVGVNSITNWLTEESEQSSVPPESELQEIIALPMANPLVEKIESENPIYQNIGVKEIEGESLIYQNIRMGKKLEDQKRPFFTDRRCPAFFTQAAIYEQPEPVYEAPVYGVSSSHILSQR